MTRIVEAGKNFQIIRLGCTLYLYSYNEQIALYNKVHGLQLCKAEADLTQQDIKHLGYLKNFIKRTNH